MKKLIATAVLVVTLAGLTPAPAQAGAAVGVALGLASFAVFNQLAFGFFAPPVWANPYYAAPYYAAPYYGGYYYGGYYPPTVYAPPPVAYYPPPVYYSQPAAASYAPPPAPPVRNEVVYPHGKYVLRGDGVTAAYQWVWISTPPPAPTSWPPPAVAQPAR
jgi:hypothetical protein